MFRSMFATVFFLGVTTLLSGAPAPLQAGSHSEGGAIVLTVRGAIEDGVAELDMAALQAMPAREIVTTTVWTDGPQTFVGVSLDRLLAELGAERTDILARALDNYEIVIPPSDAHPDGALLAYARNGAQMHRRDKGPLWIVYPYDSGPEYQSETIYARSIWQVRELVVGE